MMKNDSYKQRLELEKELREEQAKRDTNFYQQAENMFEQKLGLDEKIQEKIYHYIRVIQTEKGLGMGFFQHAQWLVSNAHVIPNAETLKSSVAFNIVEDTTTPITVSESYYRNYKDPGVPDIVILNAHSDLKRSLPINFSEDRSHLFLNKVERTHTFYIAYNETTQAYEIKYLQLRSKPDELPKLYQCLDGTSPKPGSSGAVILEARVAGESQLIWDFKVVGVLYGRSKPNHQATQQFVCAIPVSSDFSQILEIKQSRETSQRANLSANLSRLFHDAEGIAATQRYESMATEASNLAETLFQRFEEGTTPLDISLPEGFEPLVKKPVPKAREYIDTKKGQLCVSKDNHASKHLAFSKSLTRSKIETMGQQSTPATFNQDIASNYDQVLREVIIAWGNDQSTQTTNYLRYPKTVGWDVNQFGKGEETNIIELYYNEEGSHMRPKAESWLEDNDHIIEMGKTISKPQDQDGERQVKKKEPGQKRKTSRQKIWQSYEGEPLENLIKQGAAEIISNGVSVIFSDYNLAQAIHVKLSEKGEDIPIEENYAMPHTRYSIGFKKDQFINIMGEPYYNSIEDDESNDSTEDFNAKQTFN